MTTIDGNVRKTLLRFPQFNPLDPIDNEIPAPRSFSPDGKFLLYTDPRGRVCVADTETGNNWTVFQPFVDNYQDAQWTNDGSLVLTRTSYRFEWKSWEGMTYDAVIRFMDDRSRK